MWDFADAPVITIEENTRQTIMKIRKTERFFIVDSSSSGKTGNLFPHIIIRPTKGINSYNFIKMRLQDVKRIFTEIWRICFLYKSVIEWRAQKTGSFFELRLIWLIQIRMSTRWCAVKTENFFLFILVITNKLDFCPTDFVKFLKKM